MPEPEGSFGYAFPRTLTALECQALRANPLALNASVINCFSIGASVQR